MVLSTEQLHCQKLITMQLATHSCCMSAADKAHVILLELLGRGQSTFGLPCVTVGAVSLGTIFYASYPTGLLTEQ